MQSSTHMHLARALPAWLTIAVQTVLLLAPRGSDAVAATTIASSAALQHIGGPAPDGQGGRRHPHSAAQLHGQAARGGAAAPPMRVVIGADGVREPPAAKAKITALALAPADANASAQLSAAGVADTPRHVAHRYSGPCKLAPKLCGQRRVPLLAETQAQARARSESGIFGFGTIIDIVIIAFIVIVLLFFLWGGTWTQLKEDPIGALTHTVEEAKDKVQAQLSEPTLQTRMKNAAPCC